MGWFDDNEDENTPVKDWDFGPRVTGPESTQTDWLWWLVK